MSSYVPYRTPEDAQQWRVAQDQTGTADPRDLRFTGYVDRTTGLDLATRTQLAAKGSAQGRINFLQEKFGADRVIADNDGAELSDLYVYDWTPEPDREFAEKLKQIPEYSPRVVYDQQRDQYMIMRPVQVDPVEAATGDDVAEIADWVPDIAQGVAAAGIAALGATALPAAAGPLALAGVIGGSEAIASGARQAVGAILPGDEELGVGDRALRTGLDVAGGMTGELGTRGVARLVEFGWPTNVINRIANAAGYGGREAAAARKMGESLGVEMSVGEQTLSPDILRMEEILGETPLLGTDMSKARGKRISQFMRAAQRLVKKTGTAQDLESIGRQIGTHTRMALDELVADVTGQARRAYGQVHELADGAAFVEVQPILDAVKDISDKSRTLSFRDTDTIKNIVREMDSTYKNILDTAQENAAAQAAKLRDTYSPGQQIALPLGGSTNAAKTPQMDAVQFMNERQFLRKMQREQGVLVTGLSKNQNAHILRKLLSAYDEAARLTVEKNRGHPAIEALEAADATYSAGMQQIKAFEDGVLADILKKEKLPERAYDIGKDLVQNYGPGRIRQVMAFLNKHRPELAQEYRAAAWDWVIRNVESAGPMAEIDLPYSPQKLANVLTNAAKMDRFAALLTPEQFRDLRKIKSLARRMTPPKGSRTTPLGMWAQFIDKVVDIRKQPERLTMHLATFLSKRRLAKALASPEGTGLVLDAFKLAAGVQPSAAFPARLAAYNFSEELAEQEHSGPERELSQQEITDRVKRLNIVR